MTQPAHGAVAIIGALALVFSIAGCPDEHSVHLEHADIYGVRIDNTHVGVIKRPHGTTLVDIGLERRV